MTRANIIPFLLLVLIPTHALAETQLEKNDKCAISIANRNKAQADQFCRTALKSAERGDEPNVKNLALHAVALENMGDHLLISGDPILAEQMYQEALTIRQKNINPSDLSTSKNVAKSYTKLFDVLIKQGRFDAAKQMIEKALSIYQAVAAQKSSIEIAKTESSLAKLLLITKNTTESIKLYEHAIDMVSKLQSPNSPDLILLYSELGTAYEALGKFIEAERNYQSGIRVANYGRKNADPITDVPLLDLGELYVRNGKFSDAEKIYKQALEIRQFQKGVNSLGASEVFFLLGGVHEKSKNFDNAEKYYSASLKIREKELGPNNLQTASSYFALGMVLYHQNRLVDALAYLQQGTAVTHVLLGGSNPITLARWKELESFYKNAKLK